MPKKGKILAIDYGKSSMGLAISDENQQMVFGRGTLSNKKSLQDSVEKIITLCNEDQVTKVVIGLPYGKQGEETEQTSRIKKFATHLETSLTNTEISFQDESFTSFEANQVLADLHIPTKNRKQHEDELAAILILKRYLSK